MKTKPKDKIGFSKILSLSEWQKARDKLLVKEKAATRGRDALAAERRRLPMVRVEKDDIFSSPDGKAHLLDLFEGASSSFIISCSRPAFTAGQTQVAPAVRCSLIRSAISRTCMRGEEDPRGGFTQGGWVSPFWDEDMDDLGEIMSGEFDLLLGRRTYN